MIENEGEIIPPRAPVILGVKPFSRSKTIIFNALVAAFAILADQTGLLRSVLPDSGYLLLMIIVSSVNIYLRSITDTAVALDPNKR